MLQKTPYRRLHISLADVGHADMLDSLNFGFFVQHSLGAPSRHASCVISWAKRISPSLHLLGADGFVSSSGASCLQAGPGASSLSNWLMLNLILFLEVIVTL